MIGFLIQHILQALMVIVAVSIIVFLGVYAIGNPIDVMIDPASDQALREALQLSLPAILLALVLVALLGQGLPQVVVALVTAQYAYFARTTHGAASAERRKDYIEAALSTSLPARQVLFRHLLPNALPPLIVVATVQVANSIALEATLSFLGLGLPLTQPSLGSLISNGFQFLLSGRHWISIYPGIALMLTVAAPSSERLPLPSALSFRRTPLQAGSAAAGRHRAGPLLGMPSQHRRYRINARGLQIMTSTASLVALNERVAAINDVLNAASVLTWDSRTMMPPGGAETRGHQIETLTRLARDLLLSPETERALEAAERAVEHHRRVPASPIQERAALRTVAQAAWIAGRAKSDFSIFGTAHETGHGLYEQGVDPAHPRTTLATDLVGLYAVGGTSFGAHESQSRLWENHIARSRPFWQLHFPELQRLFPGQLGDMSAEEFYRAVTRVEPGFIRVEADELTYDFHIMLRVDIECALMDGSLNVTDLPSAWNAAIKRDLDLVVPDDSRGILQDVHWSTGYIGSFPTYTIGSVMAAQIMETLRQQDPSLDTAIETGDYTGLAEALRSRI